MGNNVYALFCSDFPRSNVFTLVLGLPNCMARSTFLLVRLTTFTIRFRVLFKEEGLRDSARPQYLLVPSYFIAAEQYPPR